MIFDEVVSLCQKNNTNISRVEKECELGNGTIKGWKTSKPRIDTLKKVADYFGVTIETLLGNEEKRK